MGCFVHSGDAGSCRWTRRRHRTPHHHRRAHRHRDRHRHQRHHPVATLLPVARSRTTRLLPRAEPPRPRAMHHGPPPPLCASPRRPLVHTPALPPPLRAPPDRQGYHPSPRLLRMSRCRTLRARRRALRRGQLHRRSSARASVNPPPRGVSSSAYERSHPRSLIPRGRLLVTASCA